MVEEGAVNKPQTSQMMWMLISLVMIIAIYQFKRQIGEALNVVFWPLIGFNGNYVVLTMMIAGILMISLSTIVRTLMTDTMTQAKNQREMSAFNAELRQARIENNLYKIKKLTEQQKVMMSKSMDSSMKMMKTMPITMMIVIPIFAWVWYFLDHATSVIVSVPWSDNVNLLGSMVLPVWMLMYMLVTIPFGQLIGRLIRWVKFKKRLAEIDGA